MQYAVRENRILLFVTSVPPSLQGKFFLCRQAQYVGRNFLVSLNTHKATPMA
jgi:hypothetical protein